MECQNKIPTISLPELSVLALNAGPPRATLFWWWTWVEVTFLRWSDTQQPSGSLRPTLILSGARVGG